MTPGRFSLIGPGRAGESLRIALEARGWELVNVYRRGEDVAEALEGVDVCVVATPDDVIVQVAAAIRPNPDATLLHLSGASPLSVLGDHRAAAMHPLVSLADPVRGAAALRTAWFAIAGDEMAERMANDLSGNSFPIADVDRALYHAAAAVASNHLVVILAQVERLAIDVGVPMEAFLNLVRGTVDNVAELGAASALTGPAARGDFATLLRHRSALSLHPDELELYNDLVRYAQQLASSITAD